MGNKVNQGLSKRKGGLFQLPALDKLMPTKLENPLKQLKEKLFPTESEEKGITVVEKPVEKPEDIFTGSFGERLAMQSWYDRINKENQDSWSFNINKNADLENYETQDDSLPFLFDYDSSYPTTQQHASTSKDNIVIEEVQVQVVPEMRESLQAPVRKEVPREDKNSVSEEKEKLAEHKAKLREKKRKWAESFLEHFYKKQALEEELEEALPQQEQQHFQPRPVVDDYSQYYDDHGFYQQGFRIGEDEVQAIIEAQFPDFESFGVRIPKTPDELQEEAMEDVEDVKKDAVGTNYELTNVETNQEEEKSETTTVSSEETTVLVEEETTIEAEYDEDREIEEMHGEENTNSKDILASKGDDVFINEDDIDEPIKKVKKLKKLKKDRS